MTPGNCEVNLPYPPVEVERKNPNYANLLMNDYAGRISELTAITQYSYQHFITNDKYKDLSKSLECISIVEMHHLEFLGELILLLGGDPVFRSGENNGDYWSGRYPSQSKNVVQLLKDNIVAETKAIQSYRLRITQTNDRKIQRLLSRIIMDEEKHLMIFKNYLAAFEK